MPPVTNADRTDCPGGDESPVHPDTQGRRRARWFEPSKPAANAAGNSASPSMQANIKPSERTLRAPAVSDRTWPDRIRVSPSPPAVHPAGEPAGMRKRSPARKEPPTARNERHGWCSYRLARPMPSPDDRRRTAMLPLCGGERAATGCGWAFGVAVQPHRVGRTSRTPHGFDSHFAALQCAVPHARRLFHAIAGMKDGDRTSHHRTSLIREDFP